MAADPFLTGTVVAKILGPYAAKMATEVARDYNHKAQQYKQDDVRRWQNYLEAASIAIKGLEVEYDQILAEARDCLNQPERTDEVISRIENYLTVDNLRTELGKAITGLNNSREVLQRRAESLQWWPWGKSKDRQEAVRKFNGLLKDLEEYYRQLEEQGLKHRPAGSGVAVLPLREIQSSLRDIRQEYLQVSASHADLPQSKQNDFIKVVEEGQADRTKDNLLTYTRRIQAVIDDMAQLFR